MKSNTQEKISNTYLLRYCFPLWVEPRILNMHCEEADDPQYQFPCAEKSSSGKDSTVQGRECQVRDSRREDNLWAQRIMSPRDGHICSDCYDTHWTCLWRGWCAWESRNNLGIYVAKETNVHRAALCSEQNAWLWILLFLQLQRHWTQKGRGELVCQEWCAVILGLKKSTQGNWLCLLPSFEKETELTSWGDQFQFSKILQTPQAARDFCRRSLGGGCSLLLKSWSH